MIMAVCGLLSATAAGAFLLKQLMPYIRQYLPNFNVQPHTLTNGTPAIEGPKSKEGEVVAAGESKV
jgi:hypothetical protein